MGFNEQSLSSPERQALFAAEREGQPFLVHRDGYGDLCITPLPDGESLQLGRTADNDIALTDDTEVSRAHATLEAAGAGWILIDDGRSRNGTFVNGERVMRRRRLEDRDVLRLGNTSLLFRYPDVGAPESTALSRPARGEITAAERRVLVVLCRPLLDGNVSTPASNQEVADALHISLSGVKSHVRSLFVKLNVDDDLPQNRKRAELAHRALELGLVSARDL